MYGLDNGQKGLLIMYCLGIVHKGCSLCIAWVMVIGVTHVWFGQWSEGITHYVLLGCWSEEAAHYV